MKSITLLKLGGSLITDKRQERSFQREVMQAIALEIKEARITSGPVILGHGSGSFGHFEARRYGTMEGVTTAEQWYGFCRVAHAAAELNHYVMTTLLEAGIPAMRFQPSALMLAESGMIQTLHVEALLAALRADLLPVVFGDVAFDAERGGTIASTETVFTHLVSNLPVKRVLLAGDVDGVLDENGSVIAHIHPRNYPHYAPALKGSAGTDVTGGMLTKVSDMLTLAELHADLEIRIFNGRTPGSVLKALGSQAVGTRITGVADE
jgi:isopentenyl phosphate kinase